MFLNFILNSKKGDPKLFCKVDICRKYHLYTIYKKKLHVIKYLLLATSLMF